ncbi:hypothetical protein LCGC14_0960850 [marine sediment metagenome]|uniref:Uncharacterized protein n=1 Tax=marine sediment metagenome TaxID=412755 RepID=A0A0F9NJ97_9ZZZZ
MTIREKVARAIYNSDYGEDMDGPPPGLETAGKVEQSNYGDNAGAAITAFLEAAAEQGWRLVPVDPSEGMLRAGYLEIESPAAYIYRAMLDAAPKFEVDG